MKKKAKTRKAVAKRFKITKKGKVLHQGHGSRHLKSNKTKRRIRRLKKIRPLKGEFSKKIKKMIVNTK